MANDGTKLAVLGGGPGGYAAAFYAADKGMDVTLVDPEENPGGVCLYRGCIPTKALLHAVKVKREAEEAHRLGLRYENVELDLDALRSWKEDVVKQLTSGLGQLSKRRNVHHVRGRGRFRDSSTIEIFDGEEKGSTIGFDKAVIATGAGPAMLPFLDPSLPNLITSKEALELPRIPETMLVIGAGYIGLELSTVYATLGTRVTIVEMMPGIMPGADRDLIRVFEKRVGPWFEEILTKTTVEGVDEKDGALRVTLSGEDLENPERDFDTVLVTVGRKPSLEGIGLENTQVRTTEEGYVRVNAARQTDDPSLYAVGDITGPPQLAHKASHEARVAVDHALGRNAAFDPYAIPAVEYTDPEIAWCGLTETQAEEEGRDVAVASFPWQASGRAATMGRSDGLTKLVVDPETERVLGVGIAGTNAGELIPEATLAIEMGATAEDVARTIHPHPTLSETFMEAAEAFYGLSTHIYRPKRR